ncbi:hypothetical protein [Palleronia abyssalis]|uniref:Uncharacterized protein n=1 Tax=Palleronia abyssalis TaxID=1501240 RepID=A0A2R8BZC7_9RHOB|nr:hypothetical protein [Palleronia abyssalis]SPJ25473.1 hypothetical protein PAA8504_03324 [Palleronia abyssalis]
MTRRISSFRPKSRVDFRLSHLAGFALLLTPLFAFETSAQTVVERYQAVIGAEDRRNSRGASLRAPADVLQQDRANVNRFGIRQAGDQADNFFSDRDNRARFRQLLAAGRLDPAAEQAIRSGSTTRVEVEVIRGGGRDRVVVRLASSPSVPAPGPAPGTAAGAEIAAEWRFDRDDAAQTGAASAMGPSGAAVSVRCHVGRGTPDSHVAREAAPGVAFLMISPDLTGRPSQARATVSVDGVTHLTDDVPLARPEGAATMPIVLESPLIDAIRRGRILEITAGNRRTTVALRGSSAALSDLRAYCATGPRNRPEPSPSFACGRASTDTERAICAAPRLARRDAEMARAFGRAAGTVAGSAEMQARWLESRNACRADAACLARTMTLRMAELEGEASPGAAVAALAAQSATQGLPGFGTSPEATAPAVPQIASAGISSTPVPTGGTPAPTTLSDVQQDMAAWLLGQRPEIARNLYGQSRGWLAIDWPEAAPVEQATLLSREATNEAMDNLARAFADRTPPSAVTFAVRTFPQKTPDGHLKLSLPPEMTTELPQTRDAVFQRTFVALPLLGRPATLELVADRTVPLAMPAGLAEFAGVNGLQLQFRGRLTDQRILVSPGAQSVNQRPAIRATFAVEDVTLIAEGKIVHVWPGPESGSALGSFDGAGEIAGLVALYGGAEEEGRLLYSRDDLLGRGMVRGAIAGSGGSGVGPRLGTAMRLAALLGASASREMTPEVVRTALDAVLTPEEQVALLPPAFTAGTMNDLAEARLLEEISPKIRDAILTRVPADAFQARTLRFMNLGPYDRVGGGFALRLGNRHQLGLGIGEAVANLPDDQRVPDFVSVPEDRAVELIDALPRQGVVVETDLTIRAIPPGLGRSGPITPEDVAAVALTGRLERLRLFEQTTRDGPPLLDIAFAAAPEAAGTAMEGVPPEARATTGATVLAGLERVPGGAGALEDRLAFRRDISNLPTAAKAARIAELAAEIRARTPEELFWLGADLILDAYDEKAEGFPIREVEFSPATADDDLDGTDLDGLDAPDLEVADPADWRLLPVPPAQRETVETLLHSRNRLGVLVQAPLAGPYDPRRNEGGVGRPVRILSGPDGPYGLFPTLALDIRIDGADRRFAWRAGTPVTPPETLRLTPESADLLAISQEPSLLDDAMLRRMLAERLALECGAEKQETVPVWSQTFQTPCLPLPAAALTDLLPAFRAWTEARVAALPETLILPLAEQGRMHPETGCVGAGVADQSNPARAVSTRLDALLGSEAVAAQRWTEARAVSERPAPGGPASFAVMGRPSLVARGSGEMCVGKVEGDVSASAPYADLLVHIPAMPKFGPLPDRFAAADVTLAAPRLRMEPISPAQNDGTGLSHALVVEADVAAIDIWTASNFRAPATRTVSLTPQDWNGALASPPPAFDVAGLDLSLTRSEFEAAAMARLPDATRYEGGEATRIYGTGLAFAGADLRETLLALPATEETEAPLLAMARSLRLAPDTASFPALQTSLEKKYGPPDQVFDEDTRLTLVWGTPDRMLDRRGACGGSRKFTNGSRPDLLPANADMPRYFWDYIGWPEELDRQDALVAVPQCGPTVTALLRRTEEALILTVWLHDEKAAQEMFAAAREEAEAAEPPSLDLDL